MRTTSPRERILLGFLLALAILLRVSHLGRFPLWLDEAATWWNATRPTWLGTIQAEANLPPAWWLVTRAWIGCFGDGEAALRFPAAILGAVAVALTFVLAARLMEEPAGARAADPRRAPLLGVPLLATALACLGGFWIEYAQEARMYSLLLVESLLLSILVLRWVDTGRARHAVLYFAIATLALYTHVLAIWTLLGHALFLAGLAAVNRNRAAMGRLLGIVLAQGAAVILFLPWILRILASSVGVSSGHRFPTAPRLVYSFWRLAVGPALAPIDRLRVDAGLPAFVHAEAPVLIVTAGLWALCVVLGLWGMRRRRRSGWFLILMILVQAGGMLALQSSVPLMHEKYLIALAPLLVILAAAGACTAPRPVRPFLATALLLVALASTIAYHFPENVLVRRLFIHGHPNGKEQWRELEASIRARSDPGTVVVLHPAYLQPAWDYYDRGRLTSVGLPLIPATSAALHRALPMLAGADRTFFVLAHDQDAERNRLLGVLARDRGVPDSVLTRKLELFPRQWGLRVLELGPAR
ncbi:MAG: hypothetical protein ABI960_03410 [Candidatus Eisenbacteria bacterium]